MIIYEGRELMAPSEVLKKFNISRNTFYKYMQQGIVTGILIPGRGKKFFDAALMEKIFGIPR